MAYGSVIRSHNDVGHGYGESSPMVDKPEEGRH